MNRLDALISSRPRDSFIRFSLMALGILMLLALTVNLWSAGEIFTPRRMENLSRFFSELRPWPLQGEVWSWETAWFWARGILADRGWQALSGTLAISVLAIVIAFFLGGLIALPASRRLMSPEPWLADVGGKRPVLRFLFLLVRSLVRFCMIILRGLPEYIWAFFLLALLGPEPWALVLALAIHNAGILGRFGSELADDMNPLPPSALRGLGAGRLQLAFFSVFPMTLNRFLLYFFYRWETCVREATVLGMLGVASLGFWIVDARARGRYDELFLFLLLGVLLVLVGDLLSSLIRARLRRI